VAGQIQRVFEGEGEKAAANRVSSFIAATLFPGGARHRGAVTGHGSVERAA